MHGINPRCRLVLLFCFFLHACAPAAASAPPGDGSSAEAPSSAEEVEAVDALAFFVLALLLGIFSTHLLSWTRVPYTAMLLVWGLLVGIGNSTGSAHWALLGSGVRMWENIQPNLLLTAFLPVLLFAGAIALEWHTVRRLLSSSLLLAGALLPCARAVITGSLVVPEEAARL